MSPRPDAEVAKAFQRFLQKQAEVHAGVSKVEVLWQHAMSHAPQKTTARIELKDRCFIAYWS
jgi:hypothetical protein